MFFKVRFDVVCRWRQQQWKQPHCGRRMNSCAHPMLTRRSEPRCCWRMPELASCYCRRRSANSQQITQSSRARWTRWTAPKVSSHCLHSTCEFMESASRQWWETHTAFEFQFSNCRFFFLNYLREKLHHYFSMFMPKTFYILRIG